MLKCENIEFNIDGQNLFSNINLNLKPQKDILITGPSGVGKTTFSNMLSKKLGCKLILEEFADNPFLPKFYKNPERYAFSLELFFMAERYRQLGEVRDQDLFSKGLVSDYFFVKSKLFAKNNLSDDELLLLIGFLISLSITYQSQI